MLVTKYNVGYDVQSWSRSAMLVMKYNVGREVQRLLRSTTLVVKCNVGREVHATLIVKLVLARASICTTDVVDFLSEETVYRKQHDPQRVAYLVDFI